jgi:hypothetical protein
MRFEAVRIVIKLKVIDGDAMSPCGAERRRRRFTRKGAIATIRVRAMRAIPGFENTN